MAQAQGLGMVTLETTAMILTIVKVERLQWGVISHQMWCRGESIFKISSGCEYNDYDEISKTK